MSCHDVFNKTTSISWWLTNRWTSKSRLKRVLGNLRRYLIRSGLIPSSWEVRLSREARVRQSRDKSASMKSQSPSTLSFNILVAECWFSMCSRFAGGSWHLERLFSTCWIWSKDFNLLENEANSKIYVVQGCVILYLKTHREPFLIKITQPFTTFQCLCVIFSQIKVCWG